MKFRENTAFFVFLALIIFILYVILAVRPLGTELQMTPDWTVNILKAVSQSSDNTSSLYGQSISDKDNATNTESYPFKLGQILGYFTEDGIITSVSSFAYKAAISNEYWTTYTPDATDITINNRFGAKAGTIYDGGFPFLEEDRLYLFLPGGTSVASYTPDGIRKWLYEDYVPIICFSSSSNGTIAGFADGKVILFRDDGSQAVSFFPSGSNYPIVFGVDVSTSGDLMACVSGLEQQRFVLSRNMNGHSKVLFHEFLDDSVQETTFVKFSKDDSLVYYNYNGGLGIVDCHSLKGSHVPIEGKILSIEESSIDGISFILVHNGDYFRVYILEKFDYLVGSFSFKAKNAFIKAGTDALYVGADTNISRISLSRR